MLSMKDDGGQLMGTGMLIVSTIAATFLMGLLWIVCSPAVNMMFDFFNQWILQGWITKQSQDIMTGLEIVWLSLPAFAFIAIQLNAVVKAYSLKAARL